jgi:DNA adenine methylase
MNSVFTYHGGKQSLKDWIISKFPSHTVYCEPFFGSGAVYFGKTSVKTNVINDKSDEIINFFKQLRDNGEELIRRLHLTPYSRQEYFNCREKIKEDNWKDQIERARCFFVIVQSSFMGTASKRQKAGFRTSKLPEYLTFIHKVENLSKFISFLKYAVIENLDALECIKKYDTPTTLFYLDPPYSLSECRYTHKYSKDQYRALLKTLDKIKGKFALSNYEEIEEIPHPKNWNRYYYNLKRMVKGNNYTGREVLFTNYQIKTLF